MRSSKMGNSTLGPAPPPPNTHITKRQLDAVVVSVAWRGGSGGGWAKHTGKTQLAAAWAACPENHSPPPGTPPPPPTHTPTHTLPVHSFQSLPHAAPHSPIPKSCSISILLAYSRSAPTSPASIIRQSAGLPASTTPVPSSSSPLGRPSYRRTSCPRLRSKHGGRSTERGGPARRQAAVRQRRQPTAPQPPIATILKQPFNTPHLYGSCATSTTACRSSS